MRRPAIIRTSGPYTCQSCANGTILVRPGWPEFPERTEEEGGGPGILTRMALAGALEQWLNSIYEQVE